MLVMKREQKERESGEGGKAKETSERERERGELNSTNWLVLPGEMICPVPRASEVRSNVVMTRVIGVRMGVAVDIRTIIDYKKYSVRIY